MEQNLAPTEISMTNDEEYITALRSQLRPHFDDYQMACYLSLYFFCRNFASQKRVLDAASGLGYGSSILASIAQQVVGIDIDRSNVCHAQQKFGMRNLSFQQMDVTKMGFCANTFNLVVSIETYEHLSAKPGATFLKEVVRILKPEGCFIVSTPNREVYSTYAKTKAHLHEVSAVEFRDITKAVFPQCDFYVQQRDYLQRMRSLYAPMRRDRFNLRRFLPKGLRSYVKKILGSGGTGQFENLLKFWQVEKVSQFEEMEQALFLIAVCSNGKLES